MILFSFHIPGLDRRPFQSDQQQQANKSSWEHLGLTAACWNLLFHSGCRKVRLALWCSGFRVHRRGSSSDDWGRGTRLWRSRLINWVVLPGAEVQGGVTQYKTCQIQSSAAVGHFVLPDWSPVISCFTWISSPAFIKPRDTRVEKNRTKSLKLSFHYCFSSVPVLFILSAAFLFSIRMEFWDRDCSENPNQTNQDSPQMFRAAVSPFGITAYWICMIA